MNKITAILLMACSLELHAAEAMQFNVPMKQTQFTINLPANPTTGYQWSVTQYDKKLLSLSSAKYQPPKQQLIGAGGTMVFTFSLNKGAVYPEKTPMQFKYARSWELNVGKMQEVEVHFNK